MELLTKDYSSQGNLYGRHRIDKMTKPYAPSTSLHVSNMPDNCTEQVVRTVNIVKALLTALVFAV